MTKARALTCWTSLCLGLSLSLPGRADLYWCVAADGKASLLQFEPPGAKCRLVAKDKEKKSQAEQKSEANAKATANKARNAPKIGDEEFPIISAKEQSTRDELRGQILAQELQREQSSFNFLRNSLNGPRGAQMNLEEKQYFQRRMRNHAQNIKALQQELARLE